MNNQNETGTSWGILGAVGAAVVASACCTIPLLLVSLGVGGAWVGSFTAFEPFRPLFIAAALGFLAFAGYREYKTTTAPECECEISLQDRLRRGVLVIGLLVTVGLIASPWIIRNTASPGVRAEESLSTTMQSIVLEVEGMTCDACNITVQKALMNLDGVKEATVTFEPPEAVVVYDPGLSSPDDMSRATGTVGYPSSPKEESQ